MQVKTFSNAKVVLDIGASIGIASVYLSHRFPDARVYAFELLAFLSDQFDIGVKRTLGKRLFMFQARNKSVQAR